MQQSVNIFPPQGTMPNQSLAQVAIPNTNGHKTLENQFDNKGSDHDIVQRHTVSPWYSQTAVVRKGNDSSIGYYAKRLLDITIILLALPTLLPLFVLVAIAIKFDDRGPVFFTQERVGSRRIPKDNKMAWLVQSFLMYKFRTMDYNADESVHEAYIKAFVEGELEASDVDGAEFKMTDDPRITRIGHFLRKTSLDELPQLLNVLKGEMSLVGPRPVPTYEVAGYKEPHYERLAALPGLTGLWQVEGRGQVTFEEMTELDIKYVRRQSFWYDIQILFRTVFSVLSGRGAE